MRQFLLMLFVAGALLAAVSPMRAQSLRAGKKDSVTHLLRIYEDDDYINFWGNGTDNAYTNGSRIDYFYQPEHHPHGILGRYGLRAGDSSTDIYSWGIMEIMYTPNDITRTDWQPHDYQYAGAFIASHSRYSYNPGKKYALQTEVVGGIMGPSALASQIQSGFHRLIHYTLPRGWNHQFRNDVLLNLNLTAEKQLAAAGNGLRIIAGGQVYAGTMQNGAAVYPLILVGKMNPYFDGFFSQYTSNGGRKHWQVYGLFKPELQFDLQNALLQGGMFTHDPNGQYEQNGKGGAAPVHAPELQQWVTSFTYGFVISRGKFGFSATQHVSSAMLKGLYGHTEGNVSLYFGW